MPKTKTPEEKPQPEVSQPVVEAEKAAETIPVEVTPVVTPVVTPEVAPAVAEVPKTNKKLILVMVVITLAAFLLGVATGGWIMYKKNTAAAPKEIIPQKPAESSQSAQLMASASADLTKYKIEVLNGSDVKGAAGVLKEDLSKAGFSVANTGNATSSAFIKTVLSAKKAVDEDYLVKLKEFLLKSHVLSINQDLKADAKTDILVIIGAE